MIRVLQINTNVNSGSVGKIVENIGVELQNIGFESYIFFGRGKNLSKSISYQLGSSFDILKHKIFSLFTDKHAFFSYGPTLNLIGKINEINPDILVLHNLHGYYINIEILFTFLKSRNKPIIWIFHDCWPFTGHCTYFDSHDCIKWQTHCHNCPKYNYYPKSFFIDNSFNNFQLKRHLFTSVDNLTIITPSQWLSKLVKQSFFNCNIDVVNNGIDLNLFKPTVSNILVRNNLEVKKIILGCANQWTERKGLHDFKKLSKLISSDYQIVLIGLSKLQLINLPSNILGLQKTKSQLELVEWYSAAYVFLNPTTQDNFPTTNLEALACGTPVITYNTGGSREAIDETTGFVLDKGDLQGIVNSISKLKELDYNLVSLKCRQRAELNFDQKIMFQKYLELFKKKLN